MRMPFVVVAAMLVSSAAYAQSSNAPSANTEAAGARAGAANAQAQASPSGPIAQRIRSNLEQAGFTDIQLMPSSFLVRAKDKDGNPMMMVINPDSVTAVSEIGGANQNSGKTTGSSSSSTGRTDSGSASTPDSSTQHSPMPQSGPSGSGASPHR